MEVRAVADTAVGTAAAARAQVEEVKAQVEEVRVLVAAVRGLGVGAMGLVEVVRAVAVRVVATRAGGYTRLP